MSVMKDRESGDRSPDFEVFHHPQISLNRDSTNSKTATTKSTNFKRKGSEWEILVNLEKGVEYTIKPKRYEGFLSKRRKWPLKGWHKRYFVIEQGVLTYGKSSQDINRGRTLGKINIGIAVISANYAEMRIDIDAEESVHHVKLDNMEKFGLLLEQLQQHRLYIQHITNKSQINTPLSPLDEISMSGMSPTLPGVTLPSNFSSHRASLTRGLRPARSNIIAEFAQLDDNMMNQMEHLEAQFGNLLEAIHKLEEVEPSSVEPTSHQKKKLFNLRKKKSGNSKDSSSSKPNSAGSDKDRSSPVFSTNSLHEMDPEGGSSSTLATMSSLSGSNPSLAGHLRVSSESSSRPTSLPADNMVRSMKMQSLHPSGLVSEGSVSKEDIVALASEMQSDCTAMSKKYVRERDHLKMMLENEHKTATIPNSVGINASLRQSLNAALRQNSELRTRLARIHAESDIGDLPSTPIPDASASLPRGVNGSLSYSSSCISEFFDAREYAVSGEDTDDGSESEDVESSPETEEDDMFSEATSTLAGTSETPDSDSSTMTAMTGRRRTLSVPKTETEGVNLWNLLCKNIGKDLSKISMPVTLNEPISMLQRLCEEMEYSELVEKARSSETPLERMQWVAAFAVSAYGSCNTRASHKPFNPLLGETYECVREDKAFKFISEQVSHHPPISAAQCNGQGWVWSQWVQIRSKFWGKSMEFQPEGQVSLTIDRPGGSPGETYVWNKVTSCIHNLLGAERWVDLYGESIVECSQTGLTARIQFVKASYWSNKRHEVFGTINDKQGNVLQNLFGKWSEALYVGKAPSTRCIWRPGTLPDDAELYYGFSRFAIELNEVVAAEAVKLPPTDCRWRPDQRALEEGRVSEAENVKLGIEQAQRDRKRQRDMGQLDSFSPQWFKFRESDIKSSDNDEEKSGQWEFGEEYWTQREAGFQNRQFEPLW